MSFWVKSVLRFHGGALVTQILVGELNRVAIDGDQPRHVGRAAAQPTCARSASSVSAWLPLNATASTVVCGPSLTTARIATGSCAGGGVTVTISAAVTRVAAAKPRR